MTDENPGLGHNQPPADEFTARLDVHRNRCSRWALTG